MSFQSLNKKINSLRRWIRALIVLEGAARLLLLAALFGLLSFASDYFLELPRLGRIFLFALGAAALFFSAARRIAQPLSIPLPADDLVLKIEKVNPDLNERLISAFQFSRLLKDPEYLESKELAQKVVEEGDSLSAGIRVSGILNWRHVLPATVCAAVFWSALSVYVLSSPALSNLAGIWVQRALLFADSPWPHSNNLLLIDGSAFRVSSQQKPALEVIAEGVSSAVVHYRAVGTEDWQKKRLDGESGRFSAEPFDPVDTEFFLEADGDFSRLYTVRPEKNAPSSRISLKFPDFELARKRGEHVGLGVFAKGRSIHEAYIRYRFGNSSEEETDKLLSLGGNRFEYKAFGSVSREVDFCFTGGNDRDQRPQYRISVLETPSIESFALHVAPPKYTGAAPRTLRQRHGSFKAMEGSRVEMRLRANIPVYEGRIEFENPGDSGGKKEFRLEFRDPRTISGEHARDLERGEIPEILRTPMESGGEALSEHARAEVRPDKRGWFLHERAQGRHVFEVGDKLEVYDARDLRFDFTVQAPTSYRVVLIPAEGVEDHLPAVYQIQIETDPAPVVELLKPEASEVHATLDGTVTLRIRAKDNFELREVGLRIQEKKQKEWESLPFVDLPARTKNWEAGKSIRLSEIEISSTAEEGVPPRRAKLAEGDRLLLKAWARDSNPREGVAESRTLTVRIISPNDLSDALDERLKLLKEQLRGVSERQYLERKNLRSFLDAGGEIQAGDLPTLLRRHSAQRAMSRDMADAAVEIGRILETAADNRLWDEYRRGEVQEVGGILSGLARPGESTELVGKSPKVSAVLLDAYNTVYRDPEAGKKSLSEAVTGQTEILEDLERAIDKLGAREDFHEIVRDVESCRESSIRLGAEIQRQTRD